MNKSFKSIIATTLAGIMLFGSVPAATLAGINLPALDFASVKASAASDEYTDTTIGLKFTVSDRVSITGYTNNIAVDSQGTFKIPTKLTNSNTGISYTVTSIEGYAFENCSKIKTITIPSNISNVGYRVFRGCSSLQKVIWNSPSCDGQGNGSWAMFTDCPSLTDFEFGSNVTSIPMHICNNIPSLTTVVFNGNVTEIGNAVFEGCSALKNVDLSKVTNIHEYAFNGCSSLENPVFSANLTTIGEYAFQNCVSITNLTIPSKVTNVGYRVFRGCSSLQKVIWNSPSCDGQGNGSWAMFIDCPSLTDFEFGSNVTSIPKNVCNNIPSLTTVIFKGTVSAIGANTFGGDTSILDIYYAGSQSNWDNMINHTDSGNNIIVNAKHISGRTDDNQYDNAWYHLETPAVTEYTIIYNANGGQNAPAGQNGKGSITLSAAVPTRNGYTFKGWAENANATAAQYQPGASYNLTKNTALYAVWEENTPAVTEYTLNYNANRGTGAPAAQNGNGNITLSAAAPTRSGYTFKGWAENANATAAQYQPGASYNLTKNTILYAVWEEIENIYNLGEETYSFKNFSDSHSGGHCFGMSVTSSGYYTEKLDYTEIGISNASMLHNAPDNAVTRRNICYYQNAQEYREGSTVAGGSNYLTRTIDIASDWNEVVNYVKDHKHDNKGDLQIGVQGQTNSNKICGHAVNFLRYEAVNGQGRIYVYDNNFPQVETYFYMSGGKVFQAPYSTMGNLPIVSIALRDVKTYFDLAVNHDSTRFIYGYDNEINVPGAKVYYLETDNYDDGHTGSCVMFEVGTNADNVTVTPLVSGAEFTYCNHSYEFGAIDGDTDGTLKLIDSSSYNESPSEQKDTVTDFTIRNAPESSNPTANARINVKSSATVDYKTNVTVTATATGVPEGYVLAIYEGNTLRATGTNASVSYKAGTMTASKTFTVKVIDANRNVQKDANGNELAANCEVKVNAGFIAKIIAFFRGLFGMIPSQAI